MRWSATRLRWLLLGGVFLLAAVVAGFFGIARYRAGKIWQRILARNGVNLRQETNGFTMSQSSGGRTVFTLHASKATPQGHNKWALHDAVLILYGREPGRDDRIYGSEFQYDQDAGVARAMGEVHMDLQAPEPGGKAPPAGSIPPLGFGPGDEAAEGRGLIHVRTSGLVYMRKLGLAATGEPTEFRYGNITCTSHGAEFDTGPGLVRLLADVHMTGTLRKAPFTLAAARAELNRNENTADLASPVMTSGERNGRAAHALLHLRKDGTIEAMEANGAVELRSGTQTLSGPNLNASFDAQNRPQHARLQTGVRFVDTDAAKPENGAAGTLDLLWSGAGDLSSVTATSAVSFVQRGTAQDGAASRRSVSGDQLVANFSPGSGAGAGTKRPVLRRVHVTGSAALASATQPVGGATRGSDVQVNADDLTTEFRAASGGKLAAESLTGTGRTRLRQLAADGARQESTGDTLQVAFATTPGGGSGTASGTDSGQVSSAVQTGNVEFETTPAPAVGSATAAHAQPTTGRADRAVYASAEKILTLTGPVGGRAVLNQPQGELQAQTIVLHQGSGDAEATGAVAATQTGNAGAVATHVLAARARLLHEAGISQFFGEASRPAQLWQVGSQVQAAEITLDGKAHALSARPGSSGEVVRALFATAASGSAGRNGNGRPGKGVAALGKPGAVGVVGEGVPEAGRDVLRVSAQRMDYDDAHREAVFAGDVHMDGVAGEVTAERGAAFLAPAAGAQSPAGAKGTVRGSQSAANHAREGEPAAPDLSGRLDRMVMLGNVRLTQPGRMGFGEQLTYTAATDSFALTGTATRPPRIMAEQGSSITGATLLFRGADSTIVVTGKNGDTKAAGPARVHTETDLKQ